MDTPTARGGGYACLFLSMPGLSERLHGSDDYCGTRQATREMPEMREPLDPTEDRIVLGHHEEEELTRAVPWLRRRGSNPRALDQQAIEKTGRLVSSCRSAPAPHRTRDSARDHAAFRNRSGIPVHRV